MHRENKITPDFQRYSAWSRGRPRELAMRESAWEASCIQHSRSTCLSSAEGWLARGKSSRPVDSSFYVTLYFLYIFIFFNQFEFVGFDLCWEQILLPKASLLRSLPRTAGVQGTAHACHTRVQKLLK